MKVCIEGKRVNIFRYVLAMTAACMVFAVMQGIHDNYGIMMSGIIEHTKIPYASVSFVIAVGQILYGATQPVFGMLALKKSNAFVMLCGIVLMAAGLLVTPFCSNIRMTATKAAVPRRRHGKVCPKTAAGLKKKTRAP